MKKINVEVEGSELLIQSKEGHYAVIPAKHRQEVMDMVKDGCDDCVNNYIQTLPKDSDYAQDGSLLPDDPPTIKDMERARYMSVAPIGKVKTMDDIAIESMEKSKNHPFTTYVAPKLSSVQKQTTVQPALKTNPEQEAKDRASKEEDNRTPQQKKMDEEYQERINNPTTRDFIGDVLQYPLRAIANPFGVIGDFVDIGTSIRQEQIEYNKYMLDPYRTEKEKSDMRFNTATRLTRDALLNTLPVEAAAGNMIKSGKNLIKPGIDKSATTLIKKGVESTGELLNKSEIDWGKWNKEIPKNKALMKEYEAIEKTSKADGTWMKNPDGSVFQGTPEQFVQQQSSWFKKAFRNSKVKDEIVYHGTHPLNKFEEFDPLKISSNSNDQAFYFARDRDYAKRRGGRVIEAYLDIQNPTHGGYLEKGSDGFVGNFMGVRNPTQIKSAVGNVGFFDMTNPNIYKGLIPPAIGIGAVIQSQNNKKK